MAYAGIDVGTSGCKMVVYSEKGTVIAESKRTYQESGADGCRELDASVVWEHVKEVIKEAALSSSEHIECLCAASLGESIVCVDRDGTVLGTSMLTGDKRGIQECDVIRPQVSDLEVMEITGLPLSEMYSLPKLVWMNEQTNIFDHSKYIFFYEDYIGYQLTGKRMISYSSAARSMAFDIRHKCWSDKLLSLAGLDCSRFSQPLPSGTVIGKLLPQMAKELCLPPNTLVAAGGHDQGCAGLGSGMTAESCGEDGQGTCEVMQFLMPEHTANDYMAKNGIPCAPYVLPDRYLAQIELTNCGILMNWSRDTLFADIRIQCEGKGLDFFSYMDERVKGNLPGELLVLPSFGSSGNPDVCYDARGTIWGLSIHTGPEDIYQAVKEGMAYQIYMAYKTLDVLGIRPEAIRVTGGGSASDYTLQLRADVFDIPMEVIDHSQAGTLGCAILAAMAVRPDVSAEELIHNMVHVKKRFVPRPEFTRLYRERFEHYETLYNLLTKSSSNFIMKL